MQLFFKASYERDLPISVFPTPLITPSITDIPQGSGQRTGLALQPPHPFSPYRALRELWTCGEQCLTLPYTDTHQASVLKNLEYFQQVWVPEPAPATRKMLVLGEGM